MDAAWRDRVLSQLPDFFLLRLRSLMSIFSLLHLAAVPTRMLASEAGTRYKPTYVATKVSHLIGLAYREQVNTVTGRNSVN